jgi:hypothetical protein
LVTEGRSGCSGDVVGGGASNANRTGTKSRHFRERLKQSLCRNRLSVQSLCRNRLSVNDRIGVSELKVRRKADGALKNHRHSQRDESFCYRRYVSVTELHVEDSRTNNARLQQCQRRIGASDRADDLTPGVFNQCLELERDEQLVFDNEDGYAIEQVKPAERAKGKALNRAIVPLGSKEEPAAIEIRVCAVDARDGWKTDQR